MARNGVYQIPTTFFERNALNSSYSSNETTLLMRLMRTKFVVILLSVLAVTAKADENEMIWSPNHSKVLAVVTGGRGDLIYIISGSKDIRLFYGNAADALDPWRPKLAKLYKMPVSQVGKIVLPVFIAAKWISENEIQIDLEAGFTETKNYDSFGFTVRVLVRADGRTISTEFHKKD
jgi:hypothetical protein